MEHKYFHKFQTEEEMYAAYYSTGYTEPWVSAVEKSGGTSWMDYMPSFNKETTTYSEPLTFELIEYGSMSYGYMNWNLPDGSNPLEFSIDGGNTWTQGEDGHIFSHIEVGQPVQVRGNNTSYGKSDTFTNVVSLNGKYKIYGNIMSLIDKTNFSTLTTMPDSSNFRQMFFSYSPDEDNGIVDASGLILPPTVTNYCYSNMFNNQVTLISPPPVLPATNLSNYCYTYMFNGCTNLKTAPVLPSMDLYSYDGPYARMFAGCSSLIKAPTLPAPRLGEAAYLAMFSGCSSLNYVKCLATNINGYWATRNWLDGVASAGTFVKSASMNKWGIGYSGTPVGWTIINA